jgi:hypothetical protein
MSREHSNAAIIQSSREELVDAWHRCSPWLTREKAAKVFDQWLELGYLDPVRTEAGDWEIRLK